MSSLTNMPPEIIREIALYLDARSYMSLKNTSRYLKNYLQDEAHNYVVECRSIASAIKLADHNFKVTLNLSSWFDRAQYSSKKFSHYRNDIYSLTWLVGLNLSNNNIIGGLSKMSTLQSLTSLNMSNTSISDISWVSSLVKLVTLDLSLNFIRDVKPLENLTALTTLNLRNNQHHSNTDVIARLTALTSLAVTDLDNVGYLLGLTSLKILVIPDLCDGVECIETMTQLTHLELPCNHMVNVNILKHLTMLTHLNLIHNMITDIGELANLVRLSYLNLSHNELTNIEPLRHLTSLTQLYLAKNKLIDIEPLSNLISLTRLILANNEVTDITPLHRMFRLECLVLPHNKITNIAILANLSKLDFLDIIGNRINDRSPLESMHAHVMG